MEQNLQKVIEKRIERTMESLRKNRMDAYFVKTKEEVVPLIESLCKGRKRCGRRLGHLG